jgi:photosystem II reaction center protein PsbP
MVSALRDVRVGTVIIAAAVITLLFLPLTVGTNNNTLFQSQSVFAQQQQGGGSPLSGFFSSGDQQGDFLTYENPTYGISMQYPPGWIASTSGLLDYTDLIAFYSPLQNLSDSFPARLTISVITYSQNISLPEYTDFVSTILNQSDQLDIRSSSEVTVAGHPGYRVVLAGQPFQNSTLILHQMNTWTTIGNRAYILTYEGEESIFNRHLPEMSQMLESLVITSNIGTTTTAN